MEDKIKLVCLIAAAVLTAGFAFLPQGTVRTLLFLIPYALAAWGVYREAFESIRHGEVFDENLLMAVASAGAFFIGECLEGTLVVILFEIGEFLEEKAVERSRADVKALMDICPETAVVIRDGEEKTVSPSEVEVGELILVRPGERVPLDGRIEEGTASFDLSALTGESAPVTGEAGSRVLSGSIDLDGAVRIRTESLYEQSAVARILAMVNEAADRKAHTETLITRFSRFYTPAVVALAVLLAVLPPLLGGGDWNEWIHRALMFLVVSCPCALVLSVPLTFFCGIGGASRRGILFKGAVGMETLAEAKVVVFDKTGTLTRGVFEVKELRPSGCSEKELLRLAAAAESGSHHPIARAVAETAEIVPAAQEIREFPGRGVRAMVEGRTVLVGNARFMEEEGVACGLIEEGTVVYVAADGAFLGAIILADTIKNGAAEAFAQLKELGIGRQILSGDGRRAAEAVAGQLGADEVTAEVLPDQKVAALEQIMEQNGPTVFVGDGINDAPALVRVDVGIAMGAIGSDAAVEAADVVLTDDAPEKVPLAIRLSRKTVRIAKVNIAFTLGVKLAVMALAVTGIASMGLAVFADVGVTLLAVANAVRARRE